MPNFRMPTFGNGRTNTKTACIFLFIVSNFQHVLGIPVLFLAPTLTSGKRHQWSCRDSTRLCSPCGEVGTRSVSTVSPAPLISCHWVLWGQLVSLQKCANLAWWLCGPISAYAGRKSPPARIFVLLSSSLSMLSGEIYVILKPYLDVKISFDIVTEHCCQVCVLSMMFCRSAAVCWHGKWLRNPGNSSYNHVIRWFDFNSGRPTWDMKIFFTFDFHILH